MKRSLFLLPLLAGALFFSASAKAITPEQVANNQAAWPWAYTYSATYALNNVTPTVASSAVDLSSYSGVAVNLTSVPGAQVQLEWADASGGPWIISGLLSTANSPPLLKIKSFLRFRFLPMPNQPAVQPKLSLHYSLLPVPAINAVITALPTATPIATPLPVRAAGISGSIAVTAVANLTPSYAFNATSTANTTQNVIINVNNRGPQPCWIDFPCGVTWSAGINNSSTPFYLPLSTTGGIAYGPFNNSSGCGAVVRSTASGGSSLDFVLQPVP